MTKPSLAIVRQLEAVGFRAWPATSVHYDGTWAIRMTAAHSSKRLNSINPLDPGDTRDIPTRVELAAQRFRAYGRVPCFRLSPLAPVELEDYLEGLGWKRQDETIVMTCNLTEIDLSGEIDQIPLKDIGRFVDASLSIHERPEEMRPGMSEILDGIRPNKGMFVLEAEGRAVSDVLCVQDGVMAGLFDVGTLPEARRKGYGHSVVGSALKWAAKLGAKTAWLQIEAENVAGLALYERFGFQEAYRYAYRESNEK
ncbi:GNAT family N-acetyltransferase [Ochrobactrum soli]|uniref:GNAT family N-acetyltransferase n=1 Tax=Ochrobactrum soli TaxID=2448455 RepID=UPI000EF1A3E9|nr:GNAT family N-acetyltransferase [[Ochrobactrum] soli]RLL74782.1 GNAT family N-acetyltransferase [[Ochrobactrum] soli]